MYNLFKSAAAPSIKQALPSHPSFSHRDTQLHSLVDKYFTKDFTDDSSSIAITNISAPRRSLSSSSSSLSSSSSSFAFSAPPPESPASSDYDSDDSSSSCAQGYSLPRFVLLFLNTFLFTIFIFSTTKPDVDTTPSVMALDEALCTNWYILILLLIYLNFSNCDIKSGLQIFRKFTKFTNLQDVCTRRCRVVFEAPGGTRVEWPQRRASFPRTFVIEISF
jgi:hypothetical protein